jgi:uncharacterized protein (TIGR02145 family)
LGIRCGCPKNLKTTKFSDGTDIHLIRSADEGITLRSQGYCWYNAEINNKVTYGALYNWYSVNTGNLCPIGWHVPSNQEWNQLFSYLGGMGIAGGKMKETGTAHWKSPNTGASNESGFNALPGGHLETISGPTFQGMLETGQWWSRSENDQYPTWSADRYYVEFDNVSVRTFVDNKWSNLSVRCVKNQP